MNKTDVRNAAPAILVLDVDVPNGADEDHELPQIIIVRLHRENEDA